MPSTAYLFAHRLLPGLVEANPRTLTNDLFFSERLELVRAIWREASSYSTDEQEEVPEALAFEVDERPRFSIGIVTMPAPVEVADARMIAIVVERAGMGPVAADDFRRVRYFTLEHGVVGAGGAEPGTSRTVLCEWADGQHRNHGTGPRAEREAFTTAVLRLIRQTDEVVPVSPARPAAE